MASQRQTCEPQRQCHAMESYASITVCQLSALDLDLRPLTLKTNLFSNAHPHDHCWPDGLRTLAGLGSIPGLKRSFSARLSDYYSEGC